MTNTALLEKVIKASGYKKGFIAKQLGISRAGLCNCINNRAEFKASQINALCDLLNIAPDQRSDIFFAVDGG